MDQASCCFASGFDSDVTAVDVTSLNALDHASPDAAGVLVVVVPLRSDDDVTAEAEVAGVDDAKMSFDAKISARRTK